MSEPSPARRYLEHSVQSPGFDYDQIVVDLEGRLKLNGQWLSFTSTLEVDALSGFMWRARVQKGLMRISGHDCYRDGRGDMLWRLFGLVPVMKADDADVSRSARGRAALEQVFLPSALTRPEVVWSQTKDGWARASWVLDGEEVAIELCVAADGRLEAVRMQRWSNAEGQPWRFITFGGDIRAEATFAGLTVPTDLTAGWFYGEPRFETEGRFFEALVTDLRVLK